MKILMDENIFCIDNLFKPYGDIVTYPGRLITKFLINNIDALIICSSTNVNKKLLKNSKVKFVGTTTSGIDHVDVNWLKKSNIYFSFARGCNSIAVVEYVLSALMLIAENNNFNLNEKVVGIVGVGKIGSYLNKCLKCLGVNTLLYDPFIYNISNNNFCTLEYLIKNSDILSFHTNLVKFGKNSSYHMMDDDKLSEIKDNCLILNTSRGSVINNKDLLNALKKGKKIQVVLDVWENEPNICLSLLKRIAIGTPHIAGYSFEGKIRGSVKISSELGEFLKINKKIKSRNFLNFNINSNFLFNGKINQKKLKTLMHSVYNVQKDNSLFKKFAHNRGAFDFLRKNYSMRREWSSILVNCDNFDTSLILSQIGFRTQLL